MKKSIFLVCLVVFGVVSLSAIGPIVSVSRLGWQTDSISYGISRMVDIASLPLLDRGISVHYEGSIDKRGKNADWDWSLYQDQRGEWVIFDVDGPAKTPQGMACGSMGPTTAGRMDPYVDLFQSHGGSMIMLAKGNRSQAVTDACKKHGGFYLGSIGGPAAILAQNNIKSIECVEYPELGMEAIWKIEVEDFPAFILVDNKGNDFFKQIKPRCTGNCK